VATSSEAKRLLLTHPFVSLWLNCDQGTPIALFFCVKEKKNHIKDTILTSVNQQCLMHSGLAANDTSPAVLTRSLGIFGVADISGVLPDVTLQALTSLSPNHATSSATYVLALPRGHVVRDLLDGAAVHILPTADDDDDDLGAPSEEERLLLLWGRVESYVATAACRGDLIEVVLSLSAPSCVMFLRRAVESLLGRYPTVLLTILVPKRSSAFRDKSPLAVLDTWHQAAVARLRSNGTEPRLQLRASNTITSTAPLASEEAIQSPMTSHDIASTPPSATASLAAADTPQMTPEFLCRVVEQVAQSPSRVALVAGPTGCGKSTKVPMAIIDASPMHAVWVAQPRRVAAVSLCRRIEGERGNSHDAAYVIGGGRSDSTAPSAARITFMTSGIMLQRIKSAFRDATYLKDTTVSHIILDEVHERTVEYDLLLCMLRELLRYHTSLRLVLTSATMSSGGLQLYMAQRYLQPDVSWPATTLATYQRSGAAETPLTALRRRHDCEPDAQATLATIVPVLSFHTSARRRRIVYIEEAFQTIVDAASHISREVKGSVSDAEGPGAVFHNPNPTSDTSNGIPQRYGGRDAIAHLKIPFSLTSLLLRPAHKDSLVWEARFSMTVWLIRILHYTRPVEEAILVFMGGIQQLEALELELLHNMGCTEMRVLLLHSSNDAENKALFDAPPPGHRKVLIATNIAESSLTIPDVDHVIDTCVVKDQRYLHDEDLSMLEESYCSRDSCEQRAGRTGRVRPGSVWRIITKAEFNALDEGRMPGIMQTPLTSTMLLVADANVGELDPFLAALPAPPPLRGVLAALTQLTEHYQALAPCQLRGSHLSFLQPTLKGIVLSALGLPVALGELVINGVMCGIPAVAAQAGAILASSAPLLSEDGCRLIAHMDHGTGCDVVALVELFRWWMRQAEGAHFRSDTPILDNSTSAESAILQQVQQYLRPHVLHEVRAKSRDIMRTLAGFGLASPSLLQLKRTTRWEAAEDVAPLTPSALMMCLASITLAFPNRTAMGNDIHAKHASRGRRNLYTPSHRVHLVLRGVATTADEDRIKEHLSPAACSVRIVGENRVSVDVGVERVVDVFHNVPDYSAFVVRNVRNMTWDAYRLIKCTRAERRELNIAYADSGDDVHLLSLWFVGSKAPIFIDRGSVVYPLTFDASVALPPSVVACHAVRRDNRVAYLSNLVLPGSMSVLPVVLAPILHWDGRAVDERQCLILPTLPHCHPSPRRLKQTSADLFRIVAALRESFSTCLDRVVGFYGSQEYLEAARTAGTTDCHIVDRFLLPAYQRLEKVVGRVEEDLGILLCVLMDDLPKYYAPKHVAAFVASHAHHLPSDVASRPFVAEACAVARRAVAAPPNPTVDDAPFPLSAATMSLPLPSVNEHPELLIDRSRTRQTLTMHQLRQYHDHELHRCGGVLVHGTSPSSYGGITSAMLEAGELASGRVEQHWTTQLSFPRRFAKSIPQDCTAAAIGKYIVTEIALPLSQSSAALGLIDLHADASCGLFSFYIAMSACDMLIPLRRFVLRCGASWTKEIVGRNIQLLTRHKYPNAGSMCRWHTTQNGGGLAKPSLSSPDAAVSDEMPTRYIRLIYVPPVALQSSACSEFLGADEATVADGLTSVEQRCIEELVQSLKREPPCTTFTTMDVALVVADEREDVFVKEVLRAVPGSQARRIVLHCDVAMGAPHFSLQHITVRV
jgi:superfamily II DNA/RNA helicase